MANPKCFISYSWDNDAHKDWVRFLAENLQANGVQVLLDQWDIHAGTDLTQYMETSVRISDYVLLICTPTFAQKADAGKGGVGYEKMIVTGEIFQGISSPKKFVPLLKEGDSRHSLPSYLKSKSFIDFRDNKYFGMKLEDLLRHIHSLPKFVRPPLGNKPFLIPATPVKKIVPSISGATQIKGRYCSRCGALPSGKPTTCTGAYSNHNFVTKTSEVYCSRCGAPPSGKPTTCTGAYSNHNFVTKPLRCTTVREADNMHRCLLKS